MTARILTLCADDFGLAPGISAGIARLAQAQRLTAVSCITNSPHWPEQAKRLQGLHESVDVGLHLNLTEGKPLSARLARRWPTLPSLPSLIARAHLRLLPQSELRNEMHAQLRAFMQVFGVAPRFIDGHQHIHHLPGIRETLLDMAEHVQPLPALRSTGRLLGPGFAFKRWMIRHTGGRALDAELKRRLFGHNPALLGAYDFVDPDYRGWMQRWLRALPPEGGLLFCHPGMALPDDPPDAIGAARAREFAYLASGEFGADLAAAGVTLGRVWAGAA